LHGSTDAASSHAPIAIQRRFPNPPPSCKPGAAARLSLRALTAFRRGQSGSSTLRPAPGSTVLVCIRGARVQPHGHVRPAFRRLVSYRRLCRAKQQQPRFSFGGLSVCCCRDSCGVDADPLGRRLVLHLAGAATDKGAARSKRRGSWPSPGAPSGRGGDGQRRRQIEAPWFLAGRRGGATGRRRPEAGARPASRACACVRAPAREKNRAAPPRRPTPL